MIYAFRFCQAQQWQCDVSEYTLPPSSVSFISLHRAPLSFALCAVPSYPDEKGFSLAPRVSSRAPSLPLRHFLFFWPVSRGCGAALQCCRHGRIPSCPADTAAAAPLQLQQQRRRPRQQQRPTHTIAEAARYLRGSCSGAGSPRSTRTRHWPTTLDLASSLLFPRFSYALYTAIRLGPVSLSLSCPCSSSLP